MTSKKILELLERHSLAEILDVFEKGLLVSLLQSFEGNKTQLAVACGLTRQGLIKKLLKHKLIQKADKHPQKIPSSRPPLKPASSHQAPPAS